MSSGRVDQGVHCGHATGERQGQKKEENEKFLHQRPLVGVQIVEAQHPTLAIGSR
jgi:hypothetical protein